MSDFKIEIFSAKTEKNADGRIVLVYKTIWERDELMKRANVSGNDFLTTVQKSEKDIAHSQMLCTLRKRLDEDSKIYCVYVWSLEKLSHYSDEVRKIVDLLQSRAIQLVTLKPDLVTMLDADGKMTNDFCLMMALTLPMMAADTKKK